MMRAALILAGVGLLVAMELGTPPRVAGAVNQTLTHSTVGVGDSLTTLAKADRLEIPYFQNELTIQPSSFGERMPPKDSTPVVSKEVVRIVRENRHDAKIKKVASVDPKPMPKTSDPKRRPKTTDSNKAVASTYRSKARIDVKPCRPNTFDSFLKALNLPSGCEA